MTNKGNVTETGSIEGDSMKPKLIETQGAGDIKKPEAEIASPTGCCNSREVRGKVELADISPVSNDMADRLALNAMDVRRIEEPKVREAIQLADIIYGVDRETGRVWPVWGKTICQAIAKSGITHKVPVFAFKLDFESNELEYLVAACSSVKGVPFEDEVFVEVDKEA